MAEVLKQRNMPKFKKNTSPVMKKGPFKMAGYPYPGTSPVKNEKVKNVMGVDDKGNKTWTKSKDGKSSTYTIDTKYKHKDKGTRWVNKEGGSFITAS